MAATAILEKFQMAISLNRSSDPLQVWLYGGVFGDGGSNSAIFDSNKFKMWPPPSWIISNGHISATAHDPLIGYSVHRTVVFAIAQLSCLTSVYIYIAS